jgi:hypothetical protein
VELYAAAERFLLSELAFLCERVIAERITEESALRVYYEAAYFGSDYLKRRSSVFLLAHYQSVIDEDAQQELLVEILSTFSKLKQVRV